MPLQCDNSGRRFETVTSIAIEIGDEKVKHDFGRRVSMHHARAWALHYVNVFTGEPSEFRAGTPTHDGWTQPKPEGGESRRRGPQSRTTT